MSQLTIHDLSFCESALADSNQVQGGAVASFSASFQAANSTRNSASWFIIGSPTSPNADIVASISGGTAGVTAGAISGATSDGTNFASTFTQAQARV
jgi:hypothetical protein